MVRIAAVATHDRPANAGFELNFPVNLASFGRTFSIPGDGPMYHEIVKLARIYYIELQKVVNYPALIVILSAAMGPAVLWLARNVWPEWCRRAERGVWRGIRRMARR